MRSVERHLDVPAGNLTLHSLQRLLDQSPDQHHCQNVMLRLLGWVLGVLLQVQQRLVHAGRRRSEAGVGFQSEPDFTHLSCRAFDGPRDAVLSRVHQPCDRLSRIRGVFELAHLVLPDSVDLLRLRLMAPLVLPVLLLRLPHDPRVGSALGRVELPRRPRIV